VIVLGVVDDVTDLLVVVVAVVFFWVVIKVVRTDVVSVEVKLL
jgi:hypothetical protein